MPRLSIIAILAANNVIGRGNALPWHMGADLKRFKTLTMGHHMIMGRRTYESIGSRPLPGRPTIVISHDDRLPPNGALIAQSADEALALVAPNEDEVFIAGGATIYEQFLHLADRMYLTRIHADVEGDTVFPEFDDVSEWHLVDSEHFEADEKNDYPYSFLTYERAAAEGHPIAEEG
jgi:dihydrofolate reductase